jgi:hypothetical protein
MNASVRGSKEDQGTVESKFIGLESTFCTPDAGCTAALGEHLGIRERT